MGGIVTERKFKGTVCERERDRESERQRQRQRESLRVVFSGLICQVC